MTIVLLSVAGNESSVLDFTGQGIRRVEPIPNAWPTTLIYDRNSITKVENLDQYKDTLQQVRGALLVACLWEQANKRSL